MSRSTSIIVRVLFQKHKGEFANINVLTAYLGFKERGYLPEFFEVDALVQRELDRDTIVVGGIPAVINALEILGIDVLALPSIPLRLRHYARRRVWNGTIGEARSLVNAGGSLLRNQSRIHPELFDGNLLTCFRDLIATASLPDTYPVVCSEPVAMLSEYRAFVLREYHWLSSL